MKTYTVTQEQLDRIHGAAHSGAMLGGPAAYGSCIKIEGIVAEIFFKNGFDKSPGNASEDDPVTRPHSPSGDSA